MPALGELAVSFAVTAIATVLLARLAPRLGWADDPAHAPERKRQARPVPPVGGPAILLGLAAGRIAALAQGGASLLGTGDAERWTWAALAAALATGLVDDARRGGLSPLAKVAGQSVAGLLLAIGRTGPDATPLALLGWTIAAVAAQNLVNTWDNADGAATALALCGAAARPSGLLGPLLGFLPFNLLRRRADDPPVAYLGDSGSHVLGILVLAVPAAWPVLWLPFLDLARLTVIRIAAGRGPWMGDRRHLAHRLQVAGLPPGGVVLVLVLLAAPLVLAGSLAEEHGAGLAPGLVTGLALTAAAYSLCIAWTVDPEAG